MIPKLVISADWGYALACLYGIPLLFIWRARWDRKVSAARRRLRRDREIERELGIGDEALAERVYDYRTEGGKGWT